MHGDGALERVRGRLGDRHRASGVALLDSGTAALVAALRLAVPRGGTVLLPGYGCIDISAAVERADLRARLYDLDPATLGPDLESLRREVAAVDAVVVAHLYGYPADVAAVREIARDAGVPVIEDAAQLAGGATCGGAAGDLVVLSFGRGKGVTGGGGGALLTDAEPWRSLVTAAESGLGRSPGGWRSLTVLAGLWALGRPSLYAVPSAIPWLRLGEMVYKPTGEPRAIARSAAAVLLRSLALDEDEVRRRRATADRLLAAAARSREVSPVRPLDGAAPGFLRFAVRSATRSPAPRIGAVRGYPSTLAEHAPLATRLPGRRAELPGAAELVRTLMTLPTHGVLRERDREALARWIVGAD